MTDQEAVTALPEQTPTQSIDEKRGHLLQSIRNLYQASTQAPMNSQQHEICKNSALQLEKLVLDTFPLSETEKPEDAS